MKIVFIGNHSVDYSTETHHRKTFEKLGHEVTPVQENRSNVETVLNLSSDADMVYYTHTHSFRLDSSDEIRRMFSVLKEKGIPTVGYHLDLWLGLERQKDLHNDPYWNIEHFFTVDKLMADWLNENTETKGYFLPAGVFEDECYLAEPDRNKYPHDVIFVGSKGYHKEWDYRPKLIDWLHQTYGDRFAHYGGGGKSTVRGHDLNQLYASAKVTVGDSLCINYNYPFYSSDRLWESIGRGAFLIYPKIQGIEEYFEDRHEVVYYDFGNFDQLKNLIDLYLESNLERQFIRCNGLLRCREEGTYTHRLKSLLNTLFGE